MPEKDYQWKKLLFVKVQVQLETKKLIFGLFVSCAHPIDVLTHFRIKVLKSLIYPKLELRPIKSSSLRATTDKQIFIYSTGNPRVLTLAASKCCVEGISIGGGGGDDLPTKAGLTDDFKKRVSSLKGVL